MVDSTQAEETKVGCSPSSPILSLFGDEEIDDAWFDRVAVEIGQSGYVSEDSEGELLQADPDDGRLPIYVAAKSDDTETSVSGGQSDEPNGEDCDEVQSDSCLPDLEITVGYLPVIPAKKGRRGPKSESRRLRDKERRRRRRQQISRYAPAAMRKQAALAIRELNQRFTE